MYSAHKIADRLVTAEREFHFIPSPHSVYEVEAFDEYLRSEGKYVYDMMGHPIACHNLIEFDYRWMLNEQLMCMCDAEYWLTRYAFLIDELGNVLRYNHRTAQRILFHIIADLEDSDSAIEILILKARQLGMTSLVQLLIGHRIFFGYGVNAIAGSADQQKTQIMSTKMLLAYDMMPVWLRPVASRRVESAQGMLVFGGTLSGVSFQHGAQMSGIARGTTPTIYHLSEVASFTDPASQIESSLFKCVHSSPKVFGVLETTGEGDKGWLPDKWRDSKFHWPLTRLCPLFLPWYCDKDLYPTPTWIHQRPVPSDWHPNEDTRTHTARAILYVQSSPLLAKQLGRDWQLSREKQWWWEVVHEEAKRTGVESEFLQEYCSDDVEALQRSTESAFGHSTIAEIETRRKRDYDIFGLSGQSIEASHEILPEYIDYDRERIITRYTSNKGDVYKWELVPLLSLSTLREDNSEDADGTLFIWHHPQPGVNYSIGVDTSEGKGLDSTCISVWALGYQGQPDVQCAEFCSSIVNHVEAFAFVLAIASYYGQHMALGVTRWREPYVTIEQVAAVGDTCQLQMGRMGYTNFHRMSRYDNAPRKVFKQKRGIAAKRGWYTHMWSRPLLTGNFVHAAQSGWAGINSPWLVEEMKHWEVKITATGKEKYEHEEGRHDDRIFAAAMAIFCPHDMDILAERSKYHPTDPSALPPIDLGSYHGTTYSSAQLREKQVVSLNDILYDDHRLERFSR